MKVVVTGSSGMIGGALVPALKAAGHDVTRLVRRAPSAGEIEWDPEKGTLDPKALDGVQAAINLAGANIATRWTDRAKREIRASRVGGTKLLAETLARASPKPDVLLSISAVGYYGDRGDEVLNESSGPGTGFLPSLSQDWEAAADAARAAGIRVVHPRLGIVLSRHGGALAKLLPPFKLGVGGKLGPGTQWMSWIALDDVLGALLHLLQTAAVSGPVNLVAPRAVRNSEFTQVLAHVLSRPALFTVPAPALYLVYGREMPKEALLASTRAIPQRLDESGYAFKYPALETALRKVLERER